MSRWGFAEERVYGRTRIRCLKHNKVAYGTREDADSACKTIATSGRPGTDRFTSYEGKGCGSWHIMGPRKAEPGWVPWEQRRMSQYNSLYQPSAAADRWASNNLRSDF